MIHLLKMLAMPLAFAVAVVLFVAPSAPGTAGLVGGNAYAEGGGCYGGSDTNGSGESTEYGDDGCEPPADDCPQPDPMAAGAVNLGGLGGTVATGESFPNVCVDPFTACVLAAASITSAGLVSGNIPLGLGGIWVSVYCALGF